MNKTFIASASELQTSDLYMTVKATLFTVPEANLNGVRCTHDFLSEIVEHQDKYIGLPLCADVKNLAQGRYEKLGHCYNPVTGTFLTSMIGSFYKFESVATEDDGEALVGYARILKRNKSVCKAIGELFAEGALKFSFEIACGSYETLEDQTILIDAADDNYLEGMCVVSFPACPEAVALQLVAEIEACNKDLTKEAENMPNEEAEQPIETVVAEEAAEQEAEPEKVETAEVEPEENKEVAEVVVTQTHVEVDDVRAFDTETGEEVEEHNVHETTTRNIAEEQQTEEEEKEEETAACKDDDEKKENAEIASLRDMIAELRNELSQMNESIQDVRKLFAEREEKPEQAVNPFMAEIEQPVKKYSLLESDDTPVSKQWSLLDPA